MLGRRSRLIEELSAIYPIKVLYQMYNQAISDEDYSFWFVNLVAKKREDMFMVRFEYKQIYDDPARDPQET